MTTPTKTFKIKEPNAPATEAQVKFLKSLLDTRVESDATKKAAFCFEAGVMTKGKASGFITQIKDQPKKAAPATDLPEYIVPKTPAELPTPEFGYYLTDTEALFYFDKPKNAWAPKLKKLKLSTSYSGAKTAKWINMGGTFQAKKLLAGVSALTQEQAGALGKQYGVCIRCGATLSDPVSVAQGLGPICIKYWS